MMQTQASPRLKMIRRASRTILIVVALISFTTSVGADWLVTRAGERIETEGSWQLKGRLVIFTQPGGTLASLRLSEVDLEASRAATTEAAEEARQPAVEAPSPSSRRATRTITTEDIGAGVPGADGVDLLVERLRQAHRFQDVDLAMGLVNWQDVPEGVRNYIRTQFEWMMGRRIREIRFVEAESEALEAEAEPAQVGDVLYEPNLEIAGTIKVDLFPDPDQSELGLDFQVGTRLGVYFIAASREVAE